MESIYLNPPHRHSLIKVHDDDRHAHAYASTLLDEEDRLGVDCY
ncbi:unnamed protein product [Amoebophrya sp. A25]|nr:unnamed protein product [Amoebophrya sp. A25]|eukprot:GSA25T00005036001.1